MLESQTLTSKKISFYVDLITSHTDTQRHTHTHTLKMDHKPKCKCKTANLLEGKKGENIDNVGYSNDSLVIVPKAGSVKESLSWTSLKLKKYFL